MHSRSACAHASGTMILERERRRQGTLVITRIVPRERRVRYITTEFAWRYNQRNGERTSPSPLLLSPSARERASLGRFQGGEDFRDRQLAVITHSARQSMLIDIGQDGPREKRKGFWDSIRADTPAFVRSFARPGENCAQFARK